MVIRNILFLVALFCGSTAQAVEWLDILKTHKIVLGKPCNEPCETPPMSRVREITRSSDVILLIDPVSTLGTVYPVGKEESVLKHPLMAGYFARTTDRKFIEFRTKAEIQKSVLILTQKEELTASWGQQSIVRIYKVELDGDTCAATGQLNAQQLKPKATTQLRLRFPCQLEAMSVQAEVGSKPRNLSFVNLESRVSGSFHMRLSSNFILVGDKLFEQKSACQDGSTIGVSFAWGGGPAEGQAECPFNDMHQTVRYKTSTTVSGSRHLLSGTYIHSWIPKGSRKSGNKYEIEIAFRLEGKECRIESFKYDFYDYSLASRPRNASTLRADGKSNCFFE